MLRLQAPLPDRLHPRHRPTSSTRGSAPPRPSCGDRLLVLGHHYQRDGGDPLGRRAGRLVQAGPVRGRQPRPPPTSCSAACTSWPSRPTSSPATTSGSCSPTSTPAARWPTWPTSTRSSRPGTSSAPVTDVDRVVPDHLHELVGGAQGLRRARRRRGVHLVERPAGPRLGARAGATRCCSSPTSTSAATPATRWATAQPTCGSGTRTATCGGLDERDVKDATLAAVEGPLLGAPALLARARRPRSGPSTPTGRCIVHPECAHEVVELADRVGSTERHPGVGRRRAAAARRSAVATEIHMVQRLAARAPRQDGGVARPADLPVLDDVPHRRPAPGVVPGEPRRAASS